MLPGRSTCESILKGSTIDKPAHFRRWPKRAHETKLSAFQTVTRIAGLSRSYRLCIHLMAQIGSAAMGSDPGPRFQSCVEASLAILRKAADEWALGNPEQPPTKEVLEQIIRIFEHEHFLKRGFGKL